MKNWEDDFEHEIARRKPRTTEVVRKERHRRKNVWKKGEVFKVSWRFVCQHKDGGFLTTDLKNAVVISASDSDQFTTFERDSLYIQHKFGNKLEPAYHMWPFFLGMEIVWFVLPGSSCPMDDLRSLFDRVFKKSK